MNRRLVFKLVGTALQYETYFLLIPLIVSLLFRESDWLFFLLTMVLSGSISFALSKLKPGSAKFRNREGFAAVALSWILCSFFGALPYYFSGYFNSFIDCIFESVSGFTTTGATILTDIERLPPGLLFWRSFTQWIGGIGVLVFIMTVMSSLSPSTVHLLKVEYAGPVSSKIVPKIKQTVRIIYMIYFSMTVAVIVLLKIAGLSLYDSVVHAFGVAGTGGFSNMNLSVGAFNNLAAEIIISVAVFLFGVNFSLYFYLLKKNFKLMFKDEEFLFYVGLVAVSIIVITVDTMGFYGSAAAALRHAFFQVPSMITSSGFSTTDFNQWPTMSRLLLIVIMLVGSSAGSTGCGLKMIRAVILFKAIKVELSKAIHPRMVRPVKINGKNLDQDTIGKAFSYFFVYCALIILAALVISFENQDLITTVSSAASIVSNTGPGLELVGPMGSFAFFSPFSKLVLIFCMLAGRLEVYPLLVLLSPSIWRKTAVN